MLIEMDVVTAKRVYKGHPRGSKRVTPAKSLANDNLNHFKNGDDQIHV